MTKSNLINWAIGDILEYYPMWGELTDNELLELIYKEFRNSANWFYADTNDLNKQQIREIIKEYF